MSLTTELHFDNPEEAPPGARSMVEVVTTLRDEVAAYLGLRYRGQSRELSMALAKLDEAKGWLIEHGTRAGTHVVIDKRKFPIPSTDTTVTTDREEAPVG